MKPIVLILTALALSVITACVQQSDDPFVPNKAMAAASGQPLEDLGKGHSIFMRQCTQCHEKRIPNEIPSTEWKHIVPGMAWNAGLSKEEERLVTEYVLAASKVKPTPAAQ